jgi:hypothetical protein
MGGNCLLSPFPAFSGRCLSPCVSNQSFPEYTLDSQTALKMCNLSRLIIVFHIKMAINWGIPRFQTNWSYQYIQLDSHDPYIRSFWVKSTCVFPLSRFFVGYRKSPLVGFKSHVPCLNHQFLELNQYKPPLNTRQKRPAISSATFRSSVRARRSSPLLCLVEDWKTYPPVMKHGMLARLYKWRFWMGTCSVNGWCSIAMLYYWEF